MVAGEAVTVVCGVGLVHFGGMVALECSEKQLLEPAWATPTSATEDARGRGGDASASGSQPKARKDESGQRSREEGRAEAADTDRSIDCSVSAG